MAEELCAGRDCDQVRFLKLVKFWLKALGILFGSSHVLAALAGIVRIVTSNFLLSTVLAGIVTVRFFESSQIFAEEHWSRNK